MDEPSMQLRPSDLIASKDDALDVAELQEMAARPSGYRISGLQGRVITALGRTIVAGRFAPGDLLPREAELMAEFSASRPSLREALKVLAAKGLIEMRQKVGTRVRSRDLWNMFDSDVLAWHIGTEPNDQMPQISVLLDLIELRQVIEPAAARMAAGRAKVADLNRLRIALQEMEATQDDLSANAKADVAFHVAVFGASHNTLLISFAQLVSDYLRNVFRLQQRGLDGIGRRIEDDTAQHRIIFDAINRGDGEAAARAMLDDILNGKNMLITTLERK